MRVSSICTSMYPKNKKLSSVKKANSQETRNNSEVSFKGGLKLPDYIAGGVCGTAFGVVVGSALFPPLGILAGIVAGKAVAEANRDSRPYDPNEKDD